MVMRLETQERALKPCSVEVILSKKLRANVLWLYIATYPVLVDKPEG
jgi:hypothetical protein